MTMNTLTLNPIVPETHNHKPAARQVSQVDSLRKLDPLHATNFAANTSWRAFQDGMKALYRYSGRSNADPSSIAKSNLRLLHSTLLDDQSYRERLTAAEQAISKNGLPTIVSLLAIQGLYADLITLQHGCDVQMTACEKYNRMIMVVYGNMVVNRASLIPEKMPEKNHPPAQYQPIQHMSWWNRLRNLSNKNISKQGDIFLFDQRDHRDRTLSALNHHCVLLKLSLPVDHHTTSH